LRAHPALKIAFIGNQVIKLLRQGQKITGTQKNLGFDFVADFFPGDAEILFKFMETNHNI
jgi:hypothetical protein